MISKKIERKSKDNYRRLAEYIAAAKETGEKLDQLWMVNCDAGEQIEDLNLAILEIEATQALNTRAKGDKTYHLIVSFRDEIPSPEALQDIERNFADALGFSEHQRVVATHKNTENFHMHIAYNKIHPETLRFHSPGWDYWKRDQVCRKMEKKYGLAMDLGRSDKLEAVKASPKARDFEAKTWEQSFDSYVRDHKNALLKSSHKAQNWQELHGAFAEFDLALKPRGNGLAITTKDGLAGMKASALDRSLSKAALEKRLGPFQEPKRHQLPKPQTSYTQKPVTSHKRQSTAWKKYLGQVKRKESVPLRAFRTWKDFLMYESMSDPLAMAIIMYHRQMGKALDALLPTSKSKDKGQKAGKDLEI